MEGVDIIELDVQGAELEILQGLGAAQRKRLLLAELEINISGGVNCKFSTYRGATQLAGLQRLLAEDGMRLLDISVARSYGANKGDDDWYQREVFNVYRNTPTLAAHAWETERGIRQGLTHADQGGARKQKLAVTLLARSSGGDAQSACKKQARGQHPTPGRSSDVQVSRRLASSGTEHRALTHRGGLGTTWSSTVFRDSEHSQLPQ